jgi:hypothetical protein
MAAENNATTTGIRAHLHDRKLIVVKRAKYAAIMFFQP